MTVRSRSSASPDSTPAPLLTVGEVAAQLRVDAFTVRRWIGRGELPAFLIGRHYRVDPTELARFVEARRVPAPTA